MGKYEKLKTKEVEYYASKEDYQHSEPSTKIVLKFPEPSFEIAEVNNNTNAERLASCWNACLNLENPEIDVPKLIEALKSARESLQDIGDMAYVNSFDKVNEALALIKE